MKLLLLSLLVLSIGITGISPTAFASHPLDFCDDILLDPFCTIYESDEMKEIFKYHKCLFDGQFFNMFCPSNPDNYQGAQLCIANNENCVIPDKDISNSPIPKDEISTNSDIAFP